MKIIRSLFSMTGIVSQDLYSILSFVLKINQYVNNKYFRLIFRIFEPVFQWCGLWFLINYSFFSLHTKNFKINKQRISSFPQIPSINWILATSQWERKRFQFHSASHFHGWKGRQIFLHVLKKPIKKLLCYVITALSLPPNQTIN